MMLPVIVPGWPALACWSTTSTFSPRAWLSTWPNVGLAERLTAKLWRVFSTGALLS